MSLFKLFKKLNHSMEDRIKECISILRSSNNTQDIQEATRFLCQLISEPDSIEALFNVYISSTDQYDRQHAIIYLIKSIKISWNLFDSDNRFTIFNLFKDILIKEKIWFLRNLIIDAIHIISSTGEFYEPLFQFILEAEGNGSEEFLLIALYLSPLIKCVNKSISDFLISLIERGFSISEEMTQLHFEIKLKSLHLLLFFSTNLMKYQDFSEKFPLFWEASIDILNYCENDYNLLKRVTSYYIYALRFRLNLNPLLLLQKMLTLFSSNCEKASLNLLLLIFNVIQNICHFYPNDVLESELFSPIIDLTLSLSSYLYQPDDSLSLSYSDFFESVYSDLCISDEVLQAMWEAITKVTTSEDGRFYACCSLHATLRNFPSFFDDKLIEISELLCVSLSEGKKLLCEAAARTATVFIDLYKQELEVSNEIIFAVLEACKNDTSASMLLFLADLLNTTKDSEEIFDETYPFLMEVLTSGSFELRIASLSALSALACGSTIKINVNFMELFNLLIELLQSSDDSLDQLKPSAIETLGQIISAVNIEVFSDEVFDFFSLCVENMNNDDLSFAVSCFKAVEFILQSHTKKFLKYVEPCIPILCELASKDISSMYKTSVAELIDKSILSNNENSENEPTTTAEESENENENFEEQDDFINFDSSPPILITAISLRILSYLIKNNVEQCNNLSHHVIHCCRKQSELFTVCQNAAAFSIGNLAEGIAMSRSPSFETFTESMSFILYTLMINLKYKVTKDAELLSVCFSSASKIVEWHDHESLGIYLKPILDFSMNLLTQITSEPSYDTNSSKVAEKVNQFLGMVSSSAEDEAPHLLSGFLSFYIEKLVNHSEHRFRSLASRFFADLLSSSSQNLDEEFKTNVLTFAVTLANEDGDCFAFACLRDVASKSEEIEFAKNISTDVYNLCMEKINLPGSKSKKYFLIRDNAVSTLAIFGKNVIKDSLDFDEFLPPFLNALPLVMDFTENETVMEFFVSAYNKSQDKKYLELFLRVLVIIFSNLPSAIEKFKLSKELQSSLLNLLIKLMSQHTDPNDFVCKVLDGDENRAEILQQYLKDDEQNEK